MCKSLMTLHILELIEASLQEVLKRSERISEADDFLTSESGGARLGYTSYDR